MGVTNNPTKMQRRYNKNYVIINTRKGDCYGSMENMEIIERLIIRTIMKY